MNPVITNALATTAVSEMAKLANSIVEYKKATYAIDAELIKAEYGYELELAQIKADKQQAKRVINAEQDTFFVCFNAKEKDKKSLRKMHKQVIKRAMDTQSAEEYQRLMEIAKQLESQLKEIRSEQQDIHNQFSHNIRTTQSSRKMGGVVVDADYVEV